MITIDAENATLILTDIGVTLRTLLGYAATGYKINPKRKWDLRYKEVVVGSIRLKTNFVKAEKLNEVPLTENGDDTATT